MRIDRMLAIIVMLLNRDRITARSLAKKFEVSIRTIYRDIEAINLAGIPIISYQGNNGGFGIMDNFKLDRQVLSLKDMIAILSALKGISTSLDYKELDSAIEKIDSLVPKSESKKKEFFDEQLVIDILPWGYRKKQKKKLRTVHSAIQDHILIEFVYRSSKGEKTKRTIEPMTLLFKGYAWYVFGFCTLKNDFRLFRLSRMSHLKTLSRVFTRREASFKDYWLPESKIPNLVHLVLKFSAQVRTRVEDYFDEDQISIQDNGDLIVRVSFPEDEWVYGTILSYAEYVEVLEPHHIQKIIKEKAKKISQIYKPDIQLSQE